MGVTVERLARGCMARGVGWRVDDAARGASTAVSAGEYGSGTTTRGEQRVVVANRSVVGPQAVVTHLPRSMVFAKSRSNAA